MKPFKSILSLLFVLMLLSACGSKATPATLQFDNPYAPQPDDSDLMAGDITVDSSSYPWPSRSRRR